MFDSLNRLNCVRINEANTGQYTCIVKPDGELAMAIQDMKISNAFKPNLLPKAILKKGAALLVDLNLPAATLEYVAQYASKSRPLYIEPTSLFKVNYFSSKVQSRARNFYLQNFPGFW